MLVEILQALNLLFAYKIHILLLFFTFFVVVPAVAVRLASRRYRNYTDNSGKKQKVTVVIPVYSESSDLFTRVMESVSKQKPDQVIVSIDSQRQDLKEIARKNSAELIEFPERVGKRRALAEAWSKARNDFVVQVDSDVILDEHCLEEITKPFSDPAVLGVSSTHKSIRGFSHAAYIISKVIEENMNMNNKALNGSLIVVDGRCNAWRKSHLLSLRDRFLDEAWMGVRSEIGDDRFLSREALKKNGKTVIQDSALAYIIAPPSFKSLLAQQLRWRRSGTKFFAKDVKEKNMPNSLYAYKCTSYYAAPFAFALAIALDLAFFPLNQNLWTIYDAPIIAIVGATLVTALRQIIYYNKPIYLRWTWLQAIVGLFILLPLAAYGSLTVRRQNLWLTRGYDRDSGFASKLALSLFLVAAILGSVLVWFYSITQDVFAY